LEVVDEGFLQVLPGDDGIWLEACNPGEQCRFQRHWEVDNLGRVEPPDNSMAVELQQIHYRGSCLPSYLVMLTGLNSLGQSREVMLRVKAGKRSLLSTSCGSLPRSWHLKLMMSRASRPSLIFCLRSTVGKSRRFPW
jgi:hypothetical protein